MENKQDILLLRFIDEKAKDYLRMKRKKDSYGSFTLNEYISEMYREIK